MNGTESKMIDTNLQAPLAPDSTSSECSPSVTFDTITFSDGTTIRLDLNDVVVLVGPNNTGQECSTEGTRGTYWRYHQVDRHQVDHNTCRRWARTIRRIP